MRTASNIQREKQRMSHKAYIATVLKQHRFPLGVVFDKRSIVHTIISPQLLHYPQLES